ncbi:MAG: protein kinase [Anaerolineae bacterium]|nr:protein kinase [Anaerolineae bacterium]
MSMWQGHTIGGYQIVDEIGRGGVAVVCRAQQPQLGRWVAIKILQAAGTGDEEFLARFRREARAIAALRHPNILTVYDYGEEEGLAYIVMEYVAGGTLKAELTGEPMPWPDAATLIIPIGRALAYAHSQGIIHRDVKPANVLMARPDWPLLADFGLVKVLGHQRGITRPGTSVGTPAYFSPEQAAGAEVDHRTDVYSLALILYELLTGRAPFDATSPIEMMLCRLQQPPIPPRDANPRITPRLEAIILRALARTPEARYGTMEGFVNDLESLPGATGRGPAGPLEGAAAPSVTARLDASIVSIGPRLVVMGTGATLLLPSQDQVLVGRSDPLVAPAPDVDLGPYGGGQAGVSRRHARFLRGPKNWMLEDLQSTNGTFINEVCLQPGRPAPVRHGDRVRFGQLALMFYEVDVDV